MVRVDPKSLESFTGELLARVDTKTDLIESVGKSLVNADLRGHHSHGVRRMVSKYIGEIEAGKIDPTALPFVESEGETWAQINGNRSFGQAAAQLATEIAIKKARESAIGIVSFNHVSHIGRVGECSERACGDGMAFLAFVSNPSSTWVAPPGSAQRRLSTNPISMGVPTFDGAEFDFVADLSTSQVAHGKITERAVSGRQLPEGWAIDESGEPLTSAEAYEDGGEGAMLPLGGTTAGYKGFCLGVMTELLTSNASDGSISGMSDPVWGNHVTFVAVDLGTFTSRSRIAMRAETMAEYIRSTEYSGIDTGTAAKKGRALLPGEAEYLTMRQYQKEGIPFGRADARDLVTAARKAGVENSIIPKSFLEA
ncbi:Ldh family oxidoreductase (plasmid) [Haloferacaceae archaeon DSL9]